MYDQENKKHTKFEQLTTDFGSPNLIPMTHTKFELVKREVTEILIKTRFQLIEKIIHIGNGNPKIPETWQALFNVFKCRLITS